MACLMTKKDQRFVNEVWRFYETHGRHDLPWRKTTSPYKILVSELMLQQTQVDRVVPKFTAFIKRWPTIAKLAAASQADVLRAWQGLGYNRRAKYLHLAAKAVVEQGGTFPKDEPGLRSLPGVGPYTASAIMAFAYDAPTVMIETNIRQVYLHHFFTDEAGVADTALLELIERTCPSERVREWYWALMDYGACLKRTHGNINSKSKHYIKQSKFKGSDREIRGAILRLLAASKPLQQALLVEQLTQFQTSRVREQLQRLRQEDLVQFVRGRYSLR